VIVTGLASALVAMLAIRPLPEAQAEVTSEATLAPEQAIVEQGAVPPTLSPATITAAPIPPATFAPERPLRVSALGWELLGPGVIANDGLRPGDASEFRRAGLTVEFAVALTPDELAARLARGGGVADGADVALVPLATFVASYEQLRALAPEVFFVIGWSHGRDALAAARPDLLTDAAARPSKIELVGAAGQPATLLSLFALAEVGVDIRTVELISANSDAAKRALLRAIERSSSSPLELELDARELVLTSADAPRLIPLVAVAPAGFVQRHPDELARFARVWLRGVEQLRADVPNVARRIAAEQGAPEAVALLEQMGYVSFAELGDGVRLAGLSGRSAVSLEVLFQRSWTLWRDVGVLSTPAPEHAPLDNSVVTRVALGEGAPLVLGQRAPARSGERLILVKCLSPDATIDEQALTDEIAFLAGSFARAQIELSVRNDRKASRRIIAEAIERYDLDADHVRTGPRLRGREAACVRVWVP
jgi:ABC-type nitrate/sulfonate/bicarbonate transport system substrate-binding protein